MVPPKQLPQQIHEPAINGTQAEVQLQEFYRQYLLQEQNEAQLALQGQQARNHSHKTAVRERPRGNQAARHGKPKKRTTHTEKPAPGLKEEDHAARESPG